MANSHIRKLRSSPRWSAERAKTIIKLLISRTNVLTEV